MAGATTAGTTAIRVVANTAAFETSLRRTLKSASKNLASFAAAGAALAGASIFANAIQDSIKLETEIKRLYALLDTPADKGLFSTETIRAFSDQIGLSAVEVTQSLALIVGSGINAADAMGTLEAAQNNAITSGTDLVTVTRAQIALQNAYGASASIAADKVRSASQVSDIMFAMFKEGTASFQDISTYMSTLTPIASQLGVSLEDVAAASSVNTLTGTKFRKVTTGLSYALSGLNDTTKGTGEAFKDITGQSFQDFIKKGGTLKQAVETIGKAIGSSKLTNLKGAREGLVSLQLLMSQWIKYGETEKSVYDQSAGLAKKNADEQNKTVARQAAFAKNRIKNLIGSLGDAKLPFLANLGVQFNQAIADLQANMPKIKATLAPLFEGLKQSFAGLFNFIGGIDWKGLLDIIVTALTPIAAEIIAIGKVAGPAFGALTTAVNAVIDVLKPLAPILAGIIAAWALYKTVVAAGIVVTYAITAAQWAMAASQTAVNAAMALNPYVAIAMLLVALGAALVVAWKKSEKFREIVVGALNGIKDGAAYAIEWLTRGVLGMVRGILVGFKKILDAWAVMPDWMGGGKAGDAANAVQGYIDYIDRLQDAAHALGEEARAADIKLRNAISSAEKLAQQAALEGNWFAYNGPSAEDVARQAARDAAKGGGGGAVPDFTGGSYDPGSKDKASKAADKAKQRAEQIKNAIAGLVDTLKDFRKEVRGMSSDQIDQAFENIYKGLEDSGQRKLKVIAVTAEKALKKQAKAYDEATRALETYRSARDSLVSEAKDFQKSLTESITQSGDVTGGSPHAYRITFNDISARMRKAVGDAKQFTDVMKKLSGTNLDKGILKELFEAGPGALDNALAISNSGKSGINELNKMQKELNGLGEGFGQAGYDEFYKTGVNMANALVSGLEKEQNRIGALMEKVADRMVVRLGKGLGVPTSKLGSVAVSKPVKSDNATQTIIFGDGSIQVSGADGKDKKLGVAAGMGIIDVLKSRGVAAALNGTR